MGMNGCSHSRVSEDPLFLVLIMRREFFHFMSVSVAGLLQTLKKMQDCNLAIYVVCSKKI